MQTVEIKSPYGFGDNFRPTQIVIHAMGEFIGNQHAPDFLRSVELSAHALVTPSGVVIRTRADQYGAYHARSHNLTSLGVEVLVSGVHDYGTFTKAIKTDWVTPQQWDATVELVRGWRKSHNIDTVVRHSDLDPGRKVDPGDGFSWERFLKAIAL